ncbi:MAG: glycoside hydrolase 43 family protein [Opitutus sp.]|nr:glycoside hydrolase 43 family protein [Opitutus sp.]
MKSLVPLLALLSTVLSAAEPAPVAFHSFTYSGNDAVFSVPLPAGHIQNPILAGYYPDPSICRVGDDYYLVNSTFAYFPGIPVFHSRDLVNWEQIGHVIDRPTQLNYDGLAVSRGIFAPALSWHDGTFYLTCTMVGRGGNFLMTATNPAGPWSDPIWFDFEGIDPSLFFDADGRAWMLNNGAPDETPRYSGHRAIWIQEFDIAAKKLIGERRVLVNGGVDIAKQPVWIEGPHLYQKDGWYYLCCAEGGTSIHHSQVILRSKSVTGPFEPWEKNSILTQRDLDSAAPHAVTCTGHADLFIGPDNNWWSIFLGCRPFTGGNWFTGRETFLLPVQWTDDGWPVILPPGERVPYSVKAPSDATTQPPAARKTAPVCGNFSFTDEFDRPELPLHWFTLRIAAEPWWQIARGELHVTPRAVRLDDVTQPPAFLARRVHHSNFEASTSLEAPTGEGVSAGIAAFQSEPQHFYFGVRRVGDELELFVERTHERRTEILARTTVSLPTGPIALRISGRETKLSFDCRLAEGKTLTLLAETDSYPLTVQAAGGGMHFTGAVVGVHARLE